MDLPLVGVGNTRGSTLGLGAMAAVLGIVTYNEYRSKKNVRSLVVSSTKTSWHLCCWRSWSGTTLPIDSRYWSENRVVLMIPSRKENDGLLV